MRRVAFPLTGSREDGHPLRDVFLLAAAGGVRGPAGRGFLAYKRFSARNPASKTLAAFADLWRLAAAVDRADDALQ